MKVSDSLRPKDGKIRDFKGVHFKGSMAVLSGNVAYVSDCVKLVHNVSGNLAGIDNLLDLVIEVFGFAFALSTKIICTQRGLGLRWPSDYRPKLYMPL